MRHDDRRVLDADHLNGIRPAVSDLPDHPGGERLVSKIP
jgi:hypothetical protein